MIEGMTMRMVMVLAVAAFLASESTMVMVSGRYLPTRAREDRLQTLRDLVQGLRESQSFNNNRAEVGGESGDVAGPGPSQYGGPLGLGSQYGGPLGLGSQQQQLQQGLLYKRNVDPDFFPFHGPRTVSREFYGPRIPGLE